MSNLGKYIRQILSRKEEVILPGFGSLLMSESTGIDSDSGRIDPPGVIIRFNATHPKGDGKLAQEYANGDGIDYEEARQQVLELVDAIKFKLDKGEAYSIETLGTFSRDDNNKVHFKKDPNWVIDPEMFGLSSLEILELDNEGDAATIDTTGLKDTSDKPIKDSTPPPPRARRRPVKKWRIIWIVVGSLAAVLLLILLIPSGNDIEIGKEGIIIKEASKDDSGQDNVNIMDEVDSEEDISDYKDDMHEGQTSETTDEEVPQSEPVLNQNKYFIIGGSFQNLPNATELMNDLINKGFPSEIIITENRMYRVSVQSYPTKDEAFSSVEQIKSGTGLGSVWVMTR